MITPDSIELPEFLTSPLGGIFHLPPGPGEPHFSSHHMAKSIFAGDEYDPKILIDRVDRVIDIGANCGAFAVWALSKWPGSQVDCYEPNPEVVKYCIKNVTTFGSVYPIAVTIAPSPTILWVDDTWGASSTFRLPYLKSIGKRINVQTIHPRNLPKCDILKIDAEGVEPEILLNYSHLQKVKMCTYEYHNADHRFTCRTYCVAAGLRLVRETIYSINMGVDVWMQK
jgi:FkbM family methyltransferase